MLLGPLGGTNRAAARVFSPFQEQGEIDSCRIRGRPECAETFAPLPLDQPGRKRVGPDERVKVEASANADGF